MAESNSTVCPHCGQGTGSSPSAGTCPSCSLPLCPSHDELRSRIARLARQHQGAGERLGLLQQEYGDLQGQLDRIATAREQDRDLRRTQAARLEEQDGERLQWESALEEERRLREQAEAAAAELRVVRAEDMEAYLQQNRPADPASEEMEQWRRLAEAAVPLEARIRELEQGNAALQTKLREAERSLLDAAGMVEQVTGLRGELERLGTRYLRAREEASRLLMEKLDLRSEIDELADKLQAKAAGEQPFSPGAIEQAREQIRDAIRRQHLDPPRPGE